MIEHKYIGFVCKKVNFKDNDAIFNVITKDGKKTFKARGILKITSKNAASCNFFMLSEFTTQSKTETSNQSLKTSSIIKTFKKPYEDILTASSYLFICSILDELSEQINGYELTIKCFEMLESKIYPINILNYFLKSLCEVLGYNPDIKGCIMCGKTNQLISFDFESGGFICASCFDSTRYEKIPTVFLKDLYKFLKEEEFIELEELKAQKLFKMYCLFLNDVVGLSIKNEFILSCM